MRQRPRTGQPTLMAQPVDRDSARTGRVLLPSQRFGANTLPTEILMSAHARTTLYQTAPAALIAGATFVLLWMIVTGTI